MLSAVYGKYEPEGRVTEPAKYVARHGCFVAGRYIEAQLWSRGGNSGAFTCCQHPSGPNADGNPRWHFVNHTFTSTCNDFEVTSVCWAAGGPLLDEAGRVVGITVGGAFDVSLGLQGGLAYCIPIDDGAYACSVVCHCLHSPLTRHNPGCYAAKRRVAQMLRRGSVDQPVRLGEQSVQSTLWARLTALLSQRLLQ